MKKLSWSLIKKVSLLVVAATFFLFAGISTLVSWLEYVDYYTEMIGVKDAFDDANATPVTEMKGITINYADGVEFFNNGKAAPTSKSFVVMGQYEVDGRAYEEEITDYNLTVPADFAVNGGKIEVSYLYSETKTFEEKTEIVTENGTEIITTPVDKTFERLFNASLDVVLTEVVPVKLSVVTNPYIVCYKENEMFNKAGMSAVVEYNDGSIYQDVNLNDVTVGNLSPLTQSDEEVEISYELDGVLVTGKVQIKVMSNATFTNGEIIDLYIDGGASVAQGQPLSSVVADVRMKYSSGNILSVSDYNKSFGTANASDVAQLGTKYVMQITTANNIIKKFGVSVVSKLQAESATLSNCQTETVGSDTYVANFVNGSSLSFNVTATEATYVELYTRMSNGYITKTGSNYYTGEMPISSVLQIRVNGKLRSLENTVMPISGPYANKTEALNAMRRVYLGKVFVQQGENNIVITYRDEINGLTDCDGNQPFGKFDYVEAYALSGKIFNSFSDYIDMVVSENSVPSLKLSKSRNWGAIGGGHYVMGATTDGTYIYYLTAKHTDSSISIDGGNYAFPVRIAKYDPATNSEVGTSATFNYYNKNEQWVHYTSMEIFYRSGYIYSFNENRQTVRIAVDSLNSNGNAVEVVEDMAIDTAILNLLTDVEYCAAQQKFVGVSSSDGYVHIYDSQFNELSLFKFATSSPYKVVADVNYIYIMSASVWDKKTYTTDIYVYNWEGDKIYQMTVDAGTIATGEGTTYGERYSERTLVMVGNSLYYSVRSWGSPFGSAIFKIDYNYTVAADKETLSFGTYVEACNEKGVSIKYTSQALSGVIGGVPKYAHGICTDGTYAYVAANEGVNTRIYKIDLTAKKVVGTSASYERENDWNNADYVYYKDGYVYLIMYDADRTLARVKCSDMDVDGTAPLVPVQGFDLSSASDVSEYKVHSATYNATQNKYAAVLTAKQNLSFFNGTTMAFERNVVMSAGTTVLGMTSDENYVYILYEKNANSTEKTVAGVFVYTWEGVEVKNLSMPKLSNYTSGTNVQGIFIIDGNVYFTVNNWANSGMSLVKVQFDYSIL